MAAQYNQSGVSYSQSGMTYAGEGGVFVIFPRRGASAAAAKFRQANYRANVQTTIRNPNVQG